MKIEWDFEKGLLAFMALLILAGIGVIVWQRGRAADLVAAQPRAENQLASIGATTHEVHKLRRALLDDEMAQGMQPFDFLEKQMVETKIGKEFRMEPATPTNHDGYRDTVWELTPQGTAKDFDRNRLGTFLLHIEGKTTLMKVTRIKLDESNRRGASSDDWKPTIEVTERRAS